MQEFPSVTVTVYVLAVKLVNVPAGDCVLTGEIEKEGNTAADETTIEPLAPPLHDTFVGVTLENVGGVRMFKKVLLLQPVKAVLDAVIRILYIPEPGWFDGIVARIEPFKSIEFNVPITIGAAKLPAASLNSILKIFSAFKVVFVAT